jgi:hypothetical protein
MVLWRAFSGAHGGYPVLDLMRSMICQTECARSALRCPRCGIRFILNAPWLKVAEGVWFLPVVSAKVLRVAGKIERPVLPALIESSSLDGQPCRRAAK